jgi:predicted metal-binding protein/DNA-directed RNA polymerase subunit RPC12/RpoP
MDEEKARSDSMSLNDYLKCPGPDRSSNAAPELHVCPDCDAEVEIWSDEKKGKCHACGSTLLKKNIQPARVHALPGLEALLRLAYRMGASDAAWIASDRIRVEESLARHCLIPGCENYGVSLNCPPHVSGPQGFRQMQRTLKHAIAVRLVAPTAALFSEESWAVFRLLQEIVAAVEIAAVELGYTGSKAFAGGACKKVFCREDTECRALSAGGQCLHPQVARPSMSGFGIDVAGLMKSCGWQADIAARDTGAMSWVAGLVMIG